MAKKDINTGDIFDKKNIWVKKPGTGEIVACDFSLVLGKTAKENMKS